MPKPAEVGMDNPSLQEIQAWLHTFVVQPGTSDEALAAAEDKAGFAGGSDEALILPSPTLNPRERIQIYRGMYLLRMVEALEIDFPAVAEFLGEESFKSEVTRYVQECPSQSYTLDHLGRRFATYLKDVNCAGKGHFLSDLARLEWSLCLVAIAHDSPTLVMTDLSEIPPDQFAQLQLKPIPALELLSFEHNTNTAYKAWTADQEWPDIEVKTTHIVSWRNNLQVWRMDLSQAAHSFLSHLIQGRLLGEALDFTIESYGVDEDKAFGWFHNWVSEGFFAGFEIQAT